MTRIVVFCALRWECRAVLQAMRRVSRHALGRFTLWRGVAPAREVWLVQTGIGAQRADDAAVAVAGTGKFDLFLSAGCAGALDERLRPGDLVVASAAVTEGMRFDIDPAFRSDAEEACRQTHLPWRSGAVLTSSKALTTAGARQQAAAQSGAIAVEMEAAGIARVARARNIAFAEVRAVLDTADIELHESGGLVDPQTGHLRPLAFLRHLATNPATASQLLPLGHAMLSAGRSLREFFDHYLRHSRPNARLPA